MKTFRCISKADGTVYEYQAVDKQDLLDTYDISDEYFEIEELDKAS